MESVVLHFTSPFSKFRSVRLIAVGVVSLVALIYAVPSEAHAKWFADGKGVHDVAPYALSEGPVRVWIMILLTVIAAVLAMHRQHLLVAPAWLELSAARYATRLRRLAQLALGISLFVLAVRGCILAPCLGGKPAAVFWLLLFAQAGVGCMLIADEAPKIAAAVIAVLAAAAAVYGGPASPFEAAHVLALAAYFVLASDPRYGNRAIWLLRIGLGISFGMAAFSEKLLDPSLSLQFLAHSDMNFMRHLGFDFSDRLFVLSAGMSELLLGLLLITGLATRSAAGALTVFLLASNAYLLMTGVHDDALTELIGHAPILAALFVVALLGGGGWRLRQAIGERPTERLRLWWQS